MSTNISRASASDSDSDVVILLKRTLSTEEEAGAERETMLSRLAFQTGGSFS